MSKERLEQIKDAIAYELGLTDDWMDGTYLYHLTRTKSAFAVGTMTLDDFKEIDEELLDEIFNAIEPFFIEQAERVNELETTVDFYQSALRDAVRRVQELEEEVDRLKVWYGAYHRETKTTSRLRDENKRLREALEEIMKIQENHEWNLYGLAYGIAERILFDLEESE